MQKEELISVEVDKILDTRGTRSPAPLLSVKKVMKITAPGETLEVLSSDEATKVDVREWGDKKGHVYLGIIEAAGYFRIFLEKGKGLSNSA